MLRRAKGCRSPPRRSRCLWEIVSVSGPRPRPSEEEKTKQVLFSLDRIYIDSFPRRAEGPTGLSALAAKPK